MRVRLRVSAACVCVCVCACVFVCLFDCLFVFLFVFRQALLPYLAHLQPTVCDDRPSCGKDGEPAKSVHLGNATTHPSGAFQHSWVGAV